MSSTPHLGSGGQRAAEVIRSVQVFPAGLPFWRDTDDSQPAGADGLRQKEELRLMAKRRYKSRRRAPKVETDNEPRVAAGDAGEQEGTVVQQLPNAMFRVALGDGEIVLAQVAGKLRRPFCRIMPGDKVIVEVSPYDLSRGRIVHRFE